MTRADIDRLAQALKAARVSEDNIDLVYGTWFAQVMRGNKESWNLIQRALALWAIDEGVVVCAYADQPESWAAIASLLKTHGADDLRHYGSIVMTTP
jgi:hypothetical protein